MQLSLALRPAPLPAARPHGRPAAVRPVASRCPRRLLTASRCWPAGATALGDLEMPADGQADLEEVAKVSAEEDPMKDLDQAVAEMEADLTCLLEAEAKVTASQKELQELLDHVHKKFDPGHSPFTEAGDGELEEEALRRNKALFEECAAIVSCQLERHAEAVETIIGGMRLLEDKLAEAKLEKGTQAMAALNLELEALMVEPLKIISKYK